jgi:hypothetical protein
MADRVGESVSGFVGGPREAKCVAVPLTGPPTQAASRSRYRPGWPTSAGYLIGVASLLWAKYSSVSRFMSAGRRS